MAKTKVLLITAVALVVASLLMGACAEPEEVAPPERKTIRLGHIIDFTGGMAAFGFSEDVAVRMWVHDLNEEEGGITIATGDTLKIELFQEDGKSTPEGYIAAAERLITVNKVDMLFGGMSGPGVTAVGPILDKYGINMITHAPTDPYISAVSRWMFGGSDPSSFPTAYANTVLNHMKPRPTKVAFIMFNIPSGHATAEAASKTLQEAGLETRSWFAALDETEFTSIITAMLAWGANGLIDMQPAVPSGLFLKQAGEFGLVLQKVGAAGYGDKRCRDIAGPNWEGLWMIKDLWKRPEYPKSMTLEQDVLEFTEGEHKADLLMVSSYGSQDTIKHAFEKVTKVGQDAEAQEQLNRALLATDFVGLLGRVTIRQGDPDRARLLAIPLHQVRNGEKVFVGWVYTPEEWK